MRRLLPLLLAALSAIPVAAQLAPEQLLLEAVRLQADNDLALAISRYREILRRYPTDPVVPEVNLRLGAALVQAGSNREAIRLLERVSAPASAPALASYWLGRAHLAAGDSEAALAPLRRFLEDPGIQAAQREDATLLLARALSESGQRDEALRVLPADPRSAEARELVAALRLETGDYPGVLQLVADETASPRLALIAAEAARALGSGELAADLYRQSSNTADPGIASLAWQRLYQLTPDPSERERVLLEAERQLSSEPSSLAALWLSVAQDAIARDEAELASFYLRRVLSSSPPGARLDAALVLSEVLRRDGQLGEARRVLEDLEPGSESPRLWAQRAVIAAESGDWEAVLSATQAAPAVPADDPLSVLLEYYALQAEFRLRPANVSAASVRSLLDRARGTTGHGAVLDLSIRIAARDGQTERRLSLLDELLSVEGPRMDRLSELLGLLSAGREYQAIRARIPAFRAAMQANPQSAAEVSARLSLASAELALGNPRGAVDFLEALPDAATPSESRTAAYLLGLARIALDNPAAGIQDLEPVFRQSSADIVGQQAALRAAFAAAALGRDAQEYFRTALASQADTGASFDAGLALGRWLLREGEYPRAAQTLISLASHPAAPDRRGDVISAGIEAGLALEAAGETETAVEQLSAMEATFRGDRRVARALLEAGRISLSAERPAEASDYFFRYRQQYPGAEQQDRALFLGATAAEALGSSGEATLLLGQLVDRFPDSSFRPAALVELARLQEARGEVQAAVASLSELSARYPDLAAEVGADARLSELALVLAGFDRREAELLVQIDRGAAARSEEWREATLELGNLLIVESLVPSPNLARAREELRRLAQHTSAPAADRATARFLLGEQLLRDGEAASAAESFLSAFEDAGGEGELAARSLLRASVAWREAGQRAEAVLAAERVVDLFAGSAWALEAERLLEEL